MAIGAAMLGTLSVSSSPVHASEPSGDCPIVDQLGDRVEGAVLPGACTFITKQTQFGAMPSNTPEALDARVRLYGSMFASDGTLAESGSAGPVVGRQNIEDSLRRSLTALPTLVFTPVRIVVNGNVVFYEANNEIVVRGQTLRYPALYRVVLTGTAEAPGHEIAQGRRYHDRTEWFRSVEGPALRELFAGIDDNCEQDTGVRFSGPGLDKPLTDAGCVTAYLQRLAGAVQDVRLVADQRVTGQATTFQEWRGTVSAKGRTINFGIIGGVETDAKGRSVTRLYFDTFPLSYDDNEMNTLLGKLLSAG